MAQAARMAREIKMLLEDPPSGVAAVPVDNRIDKLTAQIQGPKGTVYENGVFHLTVDIPERYPFEPPKVRFTTPVLHPNIDDGGRICLDTLNMPPKGAWRPALNVPTVLASIGLLLAEPNPKDGLMADVTHEFIHNRGLFDQKAREMTQMHAVEKNDENSQAIYQHTASKSAAVISPLGTHGSDQRTDDAVGDIGSPLSKRQRIS